MKDLALSVAHAEIDHRNAGARLRLESVIFEIPR